MHTHTHTHTEPITNIKKKITEYKIVMLQWKQLKNYIAPQHLSLQANRMKGLQKNADNYS